MDKRIIKNRIKIEKNRRKSRVEKKPNFRIKRIRTGIKMHRKYENKKRKLSVAMED